MNPAMAKLNNDMLGLTFVASSGEKTFVEVPLGTTLMQAAVNSKISNIIAECGGNCACATCHVYVDERYVSHLPKMEEMENGMLEGVAAPRQPNSRLACQIPLVRELSGMIVRLPVRQM